MSIDSRETSDLSNKLQLVSRSLQRETFSTRNEGPKVIDTQIISNLRSRNLKFDAKGLKPQTSIYGFLVGS